MPLLERFSDICEVIAGAVTKSGHTSVSMSRRPLLGLGNGQFVYSPQYTLANRAEPVLFSRPALRSTSSRTRSRSPVSRAEQMAATATQTEPLTDR